MKKTRYIFAAVAMLLLLIIMSNPEWKPKKSNPPDKDRNIEIETQNLIEEKTGAYQGFTVDLIDMELIKNLKEKGISQKDCQVSGVIDEEGNVIPDELTGSNSLLLVRFKIYNENGVGQAGEKYLLLNGSFQCEELLDKNIDALPSVLLQPHGPEGIDGKDVNRLYLDKKAIEENEDRLFLEKGEDAIFTMGMMVRREWLNKRSDARLILFPGNMDGWRYFRYQKRVYYEDNKNRAEKSIYRKQILAGILYRTVFRDIQYFNGVPFLVKPERLYTILGKPLPSQTGVYTL